MVGLRPVGVHHRGGEEVRKLQKVVEELLYKEGEEEEAWFQNMAEKMELPHLLLAKVEIALWPTQV